MSTNSHNQSDDQNIGLIFTSDTADLTTANVSYSGSYITATPSISWTDSVSSIYDSTISNLLSTKFVRVTRKLPEDALIVLLETLKEDDYNQYIDALMDIIIHPDFRKLSDTYLTEIIEDIEYMEEHKTIKLENHYNLDEYDSFRALRRLRK